MRDGVLFVGGLGLLGCTGEQGVSWIREPRDPQPSDSSSPLDPETYPPLGTECDPVITVPGSPGTAPDPHAEVYGAAPQPGAVRLGWPSNDPSRSVAFLWRTDLDTLATVVEFGSGGRLEERVEGSSFVFGTDLDGTGGYRIHEVRLCEGLEPGRTYRYRVGGDGAFSEMFTFTTPREPGTFDTFRVAFAGDSRGAYEDWAQIVHLMDSHDPDFMVFNGDAVNSGTSQAEWDAWFRAIGGIGARIPILLVHGNHEALSDHFFAQVAQPGNEQWFTVKYGNLHLVALNDTPSWSSDDLEEQAVYIDRSFAEGDPDALRMAVHHQGMFAACNTHGSNESLRDLWVPRFDRNGVRLVLNSHNHIYERSVPIRDGVAVEPAAGATYVTTGGAGGPLYTGFDASAWFGQVAVPVHHYGIADFGPGGVRIMVLSPSGDVIDDFRL